MSRSRAASAGVRFVTAERPLPLALGVLVASLAVLLWLTLTRASIGEDAFITFRTVDQFVNGNGLRWNPDERVQSYTNALWMLTSIPFYATTRSISSSSVTLGLLCTAGAYLLLSARLFRRPFVLLAGVFVPLVASRTFLIYGTSGFENSMTNLWYALFAWVYLRGLDRGEVYWGGLALAGSLGVMTRLDAVLVYIPPIACLMAMHFREIDWRRFLLGFTPIVCWLLFATFYYGYPYPNTALAKVNDEVSRWIVASQGVHYVLDLLSRDPVAFLAILVAFATAEYRGWRARHAEERDGALRLASLGVGAFFYFAYVIYVGGSYISGRHLLLPAVIGTVLGSNQLLLWARRASELDARGELETLRPGRLGLATALLAAGLAGGVLYYGPTIDPRQVMLSLAPPDNKMERFRKIIPIQGARLYLDEDLRWQRTVGARNFWAKGERLKGPVADSSKIGLTAIAAGRDMIIIDTYALADALLARLPPRTFRLVGHFKREVPPGYAHARATGSLEKMDPALQEYYRPLRLIITGPLFSWERLKEIVLFNSGYYDEHLEEYVARRSGDGRRFRLRRVVAPDPGEG